MVTNNPWSVNKILSMLVGGGVLLLSTTVTPGCGDKCQTNASNVSGQCVCNPGFVENSAGACTAAPPPPSCPANEHRDSSTACICDDSFVRDSSSKCILRTEPAPKPDLKVDNFSASGASTTDSFRLCISQSSDFISIQNIGNGNAGPYQVALGLFDVGAAKIFGSCLIDVTNGTGASRTTRLTQLGCCKLSQLTTGAQYSVFVIADAKNVVAESDKDNNTAVSQPFTAALADPPASLLPVPSNELSPLPHLESVPEPSSSLIGDPQE